MRKLFKTLFLLALLVAVAAGLYAWARSGKGDDDAFKLVVPGTDVMSIFSELSGQGRTLLVITHERTLARRAGRVVEVRDGTIIRDDAADAA